MKSIGIKLADGSFYPIMDEDSAESKELEVTTVQDNQTTVQIDLYTSETGTMEDAEYVDTLEIKNLKPHPNGEPNLKLDISLDQNNRLNAEVKDPETGKTSETQVKLVNRSPDQRNTPVNFSIDIPKPAASKPLEQDTSYNPYDNTIADDFADNPPESVQTEENSADKDTEESEVIGSPNDEDFSFDSLNEMESLKEKETVEQEENFSIEEDISESVIQEPDSITTGLDDLDLQIPEEFAVSEELALSDENSLAQESEEIPEATVTEEDNISLDADFGDLSLEEEIQDESESAEMPEIELPVTENSPATSDDDFDFTSLNLSTADDSIIEESAATESIEETSEELVLPDLDESIAEESIEETTDDLVLPDLDDSIAEETVEEDTSDADISLPDMDVSVTEEASEESTDDFSLPEMDESIAEEAVEDTADADISLPNMDVSVTEEASEESTDDFSLPEMDESIAEEAVEETTDDLVLPDLDDSIAEETVKEETSDADISLPDMDDIAVDSTADTTADTTSDEFSMPDFGDTNAVEESSDDFSLPDMDETITEEASSDISLSDMDDINTESSLESSNDFSLPDFEEETERDTTFDMPDFDSDNSSEASPVGLTGFFDNDYGEVDLSDNSDSMVTEDDLQQKDPTFIPSNNMFSDLYDKETLEGGSSALYQQEEEKSEKKTKISVIICIVCAIICIIAVALMLFIIPSKINVLNKLKAQQQDTVTVTTEENKEPVQEEKQEEVPAPVEVVEVTTVPEPAPEPAAPEVSKTNSDLPEPIPNPDEIPDTSAKEDEIVIADTPEMILPEPPAEPETKPEDIKYKIKWGDTLWDIADAYYKNPWRYNSIAKYNGIKNPNKIISGTWILIPAP